MAEQGMFLISFVYNKSTHHIIYISVYITSAKH